MNDLIPRFSPELFLIGKGGDEVLRIVHTKKSHPLAQQRFEREDGGSWWRLVSRRASSEEG